MERILTRGLLAWLGQQDRKPLVLRGARLVGKTWLARDLADRGGHQLVELNFERDPRLGTGARAETGTDRGAGGPG